MMPGGNPQALGVADATERSTSTTHPRFFFALAVVLLVTVFLGFAPTFYLAPAFDTPSEIDSLPAFLIVHGVLLTAWYLGLVMQSGLIRGGRYDLHRRVGVVGIFVAAGVVFTGAVATLGLIGRDASPQIDTLATSNSLSLLLFVPLVAVAIYQRSRPQVHKRLLLLASIVIIGPAVGPGRMLGGFLGSLLPDFLAVPAPLVFWVPLVGAMCVYDLVGSGRVHPATAWGTVAKAVSVAVTLLMVRSGAAAAYVGWLRSLTLVG
jgi:hypothetical protein